MSEVVRPAGPSDLAAIVALVTLARTSIVDARGGLQLLADHPAPNDDDVAVALEASAAADSADDAVHASADAVHADVEPAGVRPGPVVLIGEYEGVPVGILAARLVGQIIRIDLVYVEPEFRELGLGDGLLAAAMETGRRRGALAVEATALPGDRETKNLYERAGVKARAITVHRAL
ncbi:MAG: GNAT family N-acetyltransferase [Ilumatobacteraceae bacterium]